jgi:hypothetical protein
MNVSGISDMSGNPPSVAIDSDSDTSDDNLEESDQLASAIISDAPAAQSIGFDVDIDININSRALRDMVATAPIIEDGVTPVVRAPTALELSVTGGDWCTALESW